MAVPVKHYLQQLPILLPLPRALFERWVQVAAPVLSTLLGRAEYILFGSLLIEGLGNIFPVFSTYPLNDAQKNLLFFLLPLVLGQSKLPQAHELEHTALSCSSGDQSRYFLPISLRLGSKASTSA